MRRPHPFILHRQRSTKVGRLIPTTREHGDALGGPLVRSTKVGRLIPTTPLCPWCCRSAGAPLNEGREVNPDDTAHREDVQGPSQQTLNEGREVNPDDTSRRDSVPFGLVLRSTKVGRLIPTTPPFAGASTVGREVRSTKVGRLIPTTLQASATGGVAPLTAQRRSGG